MLASSRLIDRIYEASVLVETWPDLLQDIADRVGAKGAAINMRSPHAVTMIASPKILDDVNGFIAGGWAEDPEHTGPLFHDQWPGFRAETDYRTAEEVAALPVHAEYLDPRGYIAGAATVIQGTNNDAIHLAFEGFPSHDASRSTLGELDQLRPHLARAISLTALRRDTSRLVTDSLALAGVAAAVIGLNGRLRAANDAFADRMGNRMAELGTGLHFADAFLARQVKLAIEQHRHDGTPVQSIAIRTDDPAETFVIHMVPIARAARDACDADGVLLLIADPANISIPSADLLRLLFDLTPAQARVARHLAQGGSVAEATAALSMSTETARAHLKAIFAKTGVNRQTDLVRTLVGIAPPPG